MQSCCFWKSTSVQRSAIISPQRKPASPPSSVTRGASTGSCPVASSSRSYSSKSRNPADVLGTFSSRIVHGSSWVKLAESLRHIA
jgi:hypothetical protein